MSHRRTLRVATDWVDMTGLGADDRYLMVNPYFHMFGLKAGILACVASGAAMLPEPVFDVDRVLARVERERVTVLPGSPTIYQAILDHPDRGRRDLSSLRVAVTGAADIPVELIRRVDDELPFSTLITGLRADRGGNGRRHVRGRRRRDHRHDRRPAPAGLRGPHRRRGRPGRAGRGTGRDPPPRRQRDGRVSRRSRGDRRRPVGGRVAAHGGHRRGRRVGPPADRRPFQGHVHRGRLQRLSRRDREHPPAAPRRRAGGRDRGPGRAAR